MKDLCYDSAGCPGGRIHLTLPQTSAEPGGKHTTCALQYRHQTLCNAILKDYNSNKIGLIEKYLAIFSFQLRHIIIAIIIFTIFIIMLLNYAS